MNKKALQVATAVICTLTLFFVGYFLMQANRHASKIINHDPTFDVMVVSMYEWLMVPPDMEKIKDQQYMDESLNTLISEYRVQQERSRQEFDVRRDGLKQNTHTVLS